MGLERLAGLGREAWLFTLIGAVGFSLDAGLLVLGHEIVNLDWPIARLISFSAAATITWYLNRTLTFKNRVGPPRLDEWRRYLAINGVGAVLNLGIFLILIHFVPMFHDHPVAALALAAAIALTFNFLGSRSIAFKGVTTPPA